MNKKKKEKTKKKTEYKTNIYMDQHFEQNCFGSNSVRNGGGRYTEWVDRSLEFIFSGCLLLRSMAH